MSDSTVQEDLAYCADQVRQGDPDRFAAAMLAPMPLRGHLLALYAFNLELARLREAVREPMLGEIRLQWWRDAVAECFEGSPRRHQIVHPLAATIQACDLPRAPLLAMIDLRARDLDELPPADEAELTAYVDATGGALGELALRCAIGQRGEADQPKTVEIGRAMGRAWAWLGLVRGLHAHRVQGRRTVPAPRLSAAPGLDDDILKAVASESATAWTAWLLDQAQVQMDSVRAGQANLSKAERIALAPAHLGSVYLRRLRKAGNDPFRAELNTLSALRRSWSLIRFSLGGNRV